MSVSADGPFVAQGLQLKPVLGDLTDITTTESSVTIQVDSPTEGVYQERQAAGRRYLLHFQISEIEIDDDIFVTDDLIQHFHFSQYLVRFEVGRGLFLVREEDPIECNGQRLTIRNLKVGAHYYLRYRCIREEQHEGHAEIKLEREWAPAWSGFCKEVKQLETSMSNDEQAFENDCRRALDNGDLRQIIEMVHRHRALEPSPLFLQRWRENGANGQKSLESRLLSFGHAPKVTVEPPTEKGAQFMELRWSPDDAADVRPDQQYAFELQVRQKEENGAFTVVPVTVGGLPVVVHSHDDRRDHARSVTVEGLAPGTRFYPRVRARRLFNSGWHLARRGVLATPLRGSEDGEAGPAQHRFCVSFCAARTLNTIATSRVTLSLCSEST